MLKRFLCNIERNESFSAEERKCSSSTHCCCTDSRKVADRRWMRCCWRISPTCAAGKGALQLFCSNVENSVPELNGMNHQGDQIFFVLCVTLSNPAGFLFFWGGGRGIVRKTGRYMATSTADSGEIVTSVLGAVMVAVVFPSCSYPVPPQQNHCSATWDNLKQDTGKWLCCYKTVTSQEILWRVPCLTFEENTSLIFLTCQAQVTSQKMLSIAVIGALLPVQQVRKLSDLKCSSSRSEMKRYSLRNTSENVALSCFEWRDTLPQVLRRKPKRWQLVVSSPKWALTQNSQPTNRDCGHRPCEAQVCEHVCRTSEDLGLHLLHSHLDSVQFVLELNVVVKWKQKTLILHFELRSLKRCGYCPCCLRNRRRSRGFLFCSQPKVLGKSLCEFRNFSQNHINSVQVLNACVRKFSHFRLPNVLEIHEKSSLFMFVFFSVCF